MVGKMLMGMYRDEENIFIIKITEYFPISDSFSYIFLLNQKFHYSNVYDIKRTWIEENNFIVLENYLDYTNGK